jgi:aminoglycoside phosphotransferase (APT) family kinase protein
LFVDGIWTLVHGDYHPANQLYNPKTKEITTVDWEMVGLGSGP